MKVNETDDDDGLPLDYALATKQDTLARNLIEHKAEVNQKNSKGLSLIHIAMNRGNVQVKGFTKELKDKKHFSSKI